MASSKDNPSSISRASRLTWAIHAAREGAPQTPHRDVVSGKVLETKPAQRAIKYPKGGDALRQHVNEVQKNVRAANGTAARLQAAQSAAEVAARRLRPQLPEPNLAAQDLAARLQNALRLDPAIRDRLQNALQSPAAFTAPRLEQAPGEPVARPRPAAGSSTQPAIFASPADLGQIVRRTREQRRTTQAQLALAAGAGRRFISELESGKPTLEPGKVLGVMKALGLRLNVMAAPGES